MNTSRKIQSAIRARVNSQVLTVILFGLAVIAVAIVFILGGEDPVSDEGVLTGSQQEGTRDSISDIIESEDFDQLKIVKAKGKVTSYEYQKGFSGKQDERELAEGHDPFCGGLRCRQAALQGHHYRRAPWATTV